MSGWPEKLSIRDTGLYDDMGGPGQRIFTTAGRGYEMHDYYSAEYVAALSAALRDLWEDLFLDHPNPEAGRIAYLRTYRSEHRAIIEEVTK